MFLLFLLLYNPYGNLITDSSRSFCENISVVFSTTQCTFLRIFGASFLNYNKIEAKSIIVIDEGNEKTIGNWAYDSEQRPAGRL